MRVLSTCVLVVLSSFTFAQGASVPISKADTLKRATKPVSLKNKNKNVEELLASFETNSGPGFCIGIIKDGKFIFSRGYGLADLEHNIKITPSSVFNIASLSKQFTGMCIMLLQEAGKLSLQESIRKYLPEMAVYADSITIADLLHQTSGLKESSSLAVLAGLDLSGEDATEKLYQLMCRQSATNFKPGTQFAYSNSNYFLLGIIIKRVSGTPLSQFARENIFQPLGMTHTYFHDKDTLTMNKAHGYLLNDYGNYVNPEKRSYNIVGAGNLYTSVKDFLLWDQNFYHNKLGKGTSDLIKKYLTVGKMRSGAQGRYAAGLFPGNFKGMRQYNHNGSFPGYATQYFRFPDQRFSYIFFANSTSAINTYDLFDIYLLDSVKKVPQKNKASLVPVEVPSSKLSQFHGYYVLSPGMLLRLYGDDKKQFARFDGKGADEVVLVSENVLRAKNGNYELILAVDSSGNATVKQKFLVFDMMSSPFKRIHHVQINKEEIEGNYRSDDLNVSYSIGATENGLVAYLSNNRILDLKWAAKDTFYGEGIVLTFKSEGNKVGGFVLETGRAKNIVFKKESR